MIDEGFYRQVCRLIAQKSIFPFEEVWECYERVKIIDIVILCVRLADACNLPLNEVAKGAKI